MRLTIYQVDAFASEVFKGNPAAVVPLTEWIDDALMQQIAMENNLSETAFFVKQPAVDQKGPHLTSPHGGGTAAQPKPDHDSDNDLAPIQHNTQAPSPRGEGWGEASSSIAKEFATPAPATPSTAPLERGPGGEVVEVSIRWFTPDYEIDLCGHATLASAYVIKNFIAPAADEIVFSTQKAGELKTYIKDDLYTLDFPVRMPMACAVPDALLASVGLTSAMEVLKSRDYFIVVENEAAVRNLQPDFGLMKELDAIGVIVTARGDEADVVSRCFYPGAGVPEDPVTGSAHCNIVPYWSRKLGKTKLFCQQISARGGNLYCEVAANRVLMTGSCVLYLEGEINV